MLADEQYGHELGVHMRHETQHVQAAPGLVRRLRRRQTRRTWAIRTAIAGPVAAAIAAAVILPVAGPGTADTAPPQGTGSRTTSNGPLQVRNISYVTTQTLEAMSHSSDYVVYEKLVYSSGYIETWIDKATNRYRNDVYTTLVNNVFRARTDRTVRVPHPTVTSGPMRLTQSHAGSGPLGNRITVSVDYDNRAWFEDRDTSTDPPSQDALPDFTDAASIRAAISDGTGELLGEETVDGRDALHLRFIAQHRGSRIDMWVDRQTYLPIQASYTPVGSTGPAMMTGTYTWLPRTDANLARLVLTPPPGFRQVN